MFNIEHPDDYLARYEADRDRIEKRNRLARALRGATPPFDQPIEEELRAVMREQLRVQTEASR
jgi:hypothetical protein